jgi:hypothetical protein
MYIYEMIYPTTEERERESKNTPKSFMRIDARVTVTFFSLLLTKRSSKLECFSPARLVDKGGSLLYRRLHSGRL